MNYLTLWGVLSLSASQVTVRRLSVSPAQTKPTSFVFIIKWRKPTRDIFSRKRPLKMTFCAWSLGTPQTGLEVSRLHTTVGSCVDLTRNLSAVKSEEMRGERNKWAGSKVEGGEATRAEPSRKERKVVAEPRWGWREGRCPNLLSFRGDSPSVTCVEVRRGINVCWGGQTKSYLHPH